MPKFVDLTGQRFGRLTVEGFGDALNGKRRWRCRCACGQRRTVLSGSLRSGNTKSCGCLKIEVNRAGGRKGPDLIGTRFGRLTVVGRGKNATGQQLWTLTCDCGSSSVHATTNELNRGKSSCGCRRLTNRKELLGIRVGRLVAVEPVTRRGKRLSWRCKCDCGAESVVSARELLAGDTHSCGCLKRERTSKRFTKHGGSRSGQTRKMGYSSWASMKSRCLNPRHPDYANYGGRGVHVCDRWINSYEAFFSDMGPRPSSRHSLDRIDVNGNYEPGNCRWATDIEQRHNQRLSRQRVGAVLDAMKAASVDLLERAVLDRVRRELLG